MDEFSGKMKVEFTNGEVRVIDVNHCVTDMHGHPIYLVDVTNKFYNWMNIISTKKIKY